MTLCDLTIAFWKGSCVFTSNNLGFADLIARKVRKCLMLAKHSSNTVLVHKKTVVIVMQILFYLSLTYLRCTRRHGVLVRTGSTLD